MNAPFPDKRCMILSNDKTDETTESSEEHSILQEKPHD